MPLVVVVGAMVVWSAVLTAAWAATLSTLAPDDVLVGVACALACAAVAVAVRRVVGQPWRPDPRWLAWLGPLPVAATADTARLLARAAPRLLRDRERGGRLSTLSPPAGEPGPRAAFRRASGTLVLSATPGTIVVDWPPDGSPALVHELGSGHIGDYVAWLFAGAAGLAALIGLPLPR